VFNEKFLSAEKIGEAKKLNLKPFTSLGKHSKSAVMLKDSKSPTSLDPNPAAKGETSKPTYLLPIKLHMKPPHKRFTLSPRKPGSKIASKLRAPGLSIPLLHAGRKEKDVQSIKYALKKGALSGGMKSSTLAKFKKVANILRDQDLSGREIYDRNWAAMIKRIEEQNSNEGFAKLQQKGMEASQKSLDFRNMLRVLEFVQRGQQKRRSWLKWVYLLTEMRWHRQQERQKQ
jgi:hypothetical protein